MPAVWGYRGVTSGLTSEAHEVSRYALGTPNFSSAYLFKEQKQGSHRGQREHREEILGNAVCLGTPNCSSACFFVFTDTLSKDKPT